MPGPGRPLDRVMEAAARGLARRTSRRGFLTRMGALLVGASAAPLLPIARPRAASAATAAEANDTQIAGQEGDPARCEYWRHCAIDGFLCSCCGGSQSACPPGTQMSPVTWIGTCRNPADGKDYLISYNDCCGTAPCARCFCNRNEGDRPVYQPGKSNEINWCTGSPSLAYHCSTAIVLGLAAEGS